jgi:hypothetical protein
MKRSTKLKNVLSEVLKTIEIGRYRYVGHANERLQQRSITRLEVKQILKNGHHEKRKDVFNEKHNCWNYSIRGKTIDKRSLRIVIT